VGASATSPVILESSVQPPSATPNTTAAGTPNVNLMNETNDIEQPQVRKQFVALSCPT
jgi:hypothetical protein